MIRYTFEEKQAAKKAKKEFKKANKGKKVEIVRVSLTSEPPKRKIA